MGIKRRAILILAIEQHLGHPVEDRPPSNPLPSSSGTDHNTEAWVKGYITVRNVTLYRRTGSVRSLSRVSSVLTPGDPSGWSPLEFYQAGQLPWDIDLTVEKPVRRRGRGHTQTLTWLRLWLWLNISELILEWHRCEKNRSVKNRILGRQTHDGESRDTRNHILYPVNTIHQSSPPPFSRISTIGE